MLFGGVSYDVLNFVVNGLGDNMLEFIVLEGNYFFMGDNCDNFGDLCWFVMVGGVGMVLVEYLIGCVDWIMFFLVGKLFLYFWIWCVDCFFKVVD